MPYLPSGRSLYLAMLALFSRSREEDLFIVVPNRWWDSYDFFIHIWLDWPNMSVRERAARDTAMSEGRLQPDAGYVMWHYLYFRMLCRSFVHLTGKPYARFYKPVLAPPLGGGRWYLGTTVTYSLDTYSSYTRRYMRRYIKLLERIASLRNEEIPLEARIPFESVDDRFDVDKLIRHAARVAARFNSTALEKRATTITWQVSLSMSLPAL